MYFLLYFHIFLWVKSPPDPTRSVEIQILKIQSSHLLVHVHMRPYLNQELDLNLGSSILFGDMVILMIV